MGTVVPPPSVTGEGAVALRLGWASGGATPAAAEIPAGVAPVGVAPGVRARSAMLVWRPATELEGVEPNETSENPSGGADVE